MTESSDLERWNYVDLYILYIIQIQSHFKNHYNEINKKTKHYFLCI